MRPARGSLLCDGQVLGQVRPADQGVIVRRQRKKNGYSGRHDNLGGSRGSWKKLRATREALLLGKIKASDGVQFTFRVRSEPLVRFNCRIEITCEYRGTELIL